jgi:DNA-directed RNA polymerase specialized sigma24 family protein
MNDTPQLWDAYKRADDQAAFGQLVARHIDLVYGLALRRGHGRHDLAEDVAQAVFADLARARNQVRDGAAVPGWLCRHAGQAYVWRAGKGARDVLELLTTNNIAVPEGWALRAAIAISEDGRSLCGNGTNPAGRDEGWLVTLPASIAQLP